MGAANDLSGSEVGVVPFFHRSHLFSIIAHIANIVDRLITERNTCVQGTWCKVHMPNGKKHHNSLKDNSIALTHVRAFSAFSKPQHPNELTGRSR
jgi:hypothetical protein